MKKTRKQVIIFGIAMALLWAVVFTIVMRNPVGILLGVLFGGAYMGTIRIMTKHIEDNNNESEK